jgi:hypothetical protein
MAELAARKSGAPAGGIAGSAQQAQVQQMHAEQQRQAEAARQQQQMHQAQQQQEAMFMRERALQMERQQQHMLGAAAPPPPPPVPQAQALPPPYGVAMTGVAMTPGPVIHPPPPFPVAAHSPYNEAVAALNNDLHKLYEDRKNWFEQMTFQADQLRQKRAETYHRILDELKGKQVAAVARLEKARASGGEEAAEIEMVLVRINEELQNSEAAWTSKTKDFELKVDAKLKDGQTHFYNLEAQIRAQHPLPPPSPHSFTPHNPLAYPPVRPPSHVAQVPAAAQAKSKRGSLPHQKPLDAALKKAKREAKAAREEKGKQQAQAGAQHP